MIAGGELVVAAANEVEGWQHATGPQAPPSARKVRSRRLLGSGPTSPKGEAIPLRAAAEELDLEAPLVYRSRLSDELIQALVG